MLIGVIGAGISGLTAARNLAIAGHEVIVFEKSRGFGGRLATRYSGENKSIRFDHGSPHISGKDPRFLEFIEDLESKGIIKKWCDGFHYWNGETLYDKHPERVETPYYYAPEGINSIGHYLARWVDVRLNSRVIGMTYLGDKKGKKSPWMLNFESSETVEVDAIIIATPAVQTYGLIENSQDEIIFRRIIKDLDEIVYNPKYSLMLTYNKQEIPEWKGISCKDDTIHWISNESSKRANEGKLTLVCHSRGPFTRNHLFKDSDTDKVRSEMVLALRKIIGDWAGNFDAADMRLWRYSQPRTFFDKDYVSTGNPNSPVAIIGDYLKGSTTEHAYISGLELAKHWADRLKV
jgi:renalase